LLLVTPAKPDHIEATTALLEETDVFYGVTEFAPAEKRADQVREALVDDEGDPVG
jgi:hypothetical protein